MGRGDRRPLYTAEDVVKKRSRPPQESDLPAQPSTSGPALSTSVPTGVSVGSTAPHAVQQQQLQQPGAQPVDGIPPQQQQLLLTDFQQPCTIKGLSSALYAGALGYFFGVVPAIVKHRMRSWGLVHQAGVKSASQLAIMSGLYTAVHCMVTRIRQKDDGWARGIAGCSTGLVLGWGGGPMSALQSCAGIGFISYILDFGGAATTQPAQAAAMMSRSRGRGDAAAHGSGMGRGWEVPVPLEGLLGAALVLPPVVWLGHCCQAQQGVGAAAVDACPLGALLKRPGGQTGPR